MSKPNYLIVGNGRLARHWRHYLSTQFQVLRWHRNLARETLSGLADRADFVLLMVSDNAIAELKDWPEFSHSRLIHFSGSNYFTDVLGLHPLMSFTEDLYDLKSYEKIPVAIDDPQITLQDIFPGFKNPYFYISPEHKNLYHALCVSSGNFLTLQLQENFKLAQNELGIHPKYFKEFLQKTLDNVFADADHALTGPLSRNDQQTIAKHREALSGTSLSPIYDTYLELWKNLNDGATQ